MILLEGVRSRPPAPAAGAMHIVHGVLSLDVGGLERIVVDLVRMARRGPHRVSIVCVERPGQLAAAAETAGAEIISLNKPPGRHPWVVDQAREVLRRLEPSVVHTHTVGALWYLGPGAQALDIPVVHTEHVDNVRKARGIPAKLKTRLLWNRASRLADRFCGVSGDVTAAAARWRTVPRRKLSTVLNGIDMDRGHDPDARSLVRASLGIPTAARVVGTVGRLNEVKRQDLLLTAVAALGAGFGDVHVLLVGDGPERDALGRLAASLGLAARVKFAGYQESPERFLAALDLFALTSRMEGLPLALLEAWSAGLPVVASAVGGVPDVVRPGTTGWLFPSGDVEALRQALQDALSDPARAAATAAAGRVLVRKCYSLHRMAADYEALYQAVIVERRGGR